MELAELSLAITQTIHQIGLSLFFLPTFLTHLFLESEISILRQLSWRLGLSAGLSVYNVMGNLADKEAVSFINSDLSIPRPPSATQSPSPRASRKPTLSSSDKNC